MREEEKAKDSFEPDFEKGGGLVAAIAQDHSTGEVLMLAWMNREAWEKTPSLLMC